MANLKKDVLLSNKSHLKCIDLLKNQCQSKNSELWHLKSKIKYHSEIIKTQSDCNMVLNARRKNQFYSIYVGKK